MGADDSGEDLVVGETNAGQSGTDLRAKEDEDGNYANHFVFRADGTNSFIHRDVDGIQSHANLGGTGLLATSQYGDGAFGRTKADNKSGVVGRNDGGGLGVYGSSEAGDGVYGISTGDNKSGTVGIHVGGGNGVYGSSVAGDGVYGISTGDNKSGTVGWNNASGFGVFGHSERGAGVYGETLFAETNGPAVHGVGVGFATGVMGDAKNGTGVWGRSEIGQHHNALAGVVGSGYAQAEGAGVIGLSFSATDGVGVIGRAPHGTGVLGISGPVKVRISGQSVGGPDVYGVSQALNSSGVFGENIAEPKPGLPAEVVGVTGRANATLGTGVVGESAKGAGLAGKGGLYGATLQGGLAPVRLIPSLTVTGAPQSGFHHRGELFVDTTGSLFYCKADGVPGTWVQLA
jgi:hypothetical protein